METGGAGDRASPKSFKRNKRDPLMRPRSAISIRASGHGIDRTNRPYTPLSKVLLKSLVSAGPSIHEALDKGILRGLAGRAVVPDDAALVRPRQDGVAGEFGAVR